MARLCRRIHVVRETGGAQSTSRCGEMVKESCSMSAPRVNATVRRKGHIVDVVRAVASWL